MKTTIEIYDHETIRDFLNHLEQLKEDTLFQAGLLNLNLEEDAMSPSMELDYDNCFGSHIVTTEP